MTVIKLIFGRSVEAATYAIELLADPTTEIGAAKSCRSDPRFDVAIVIENTDTRRNWNRELVPNAPADLDAIACAASCASAGRTNAGAGVIVSSDPGAQDRLYVATDSLPAVVRTTPGAPR